MSRWSGTEENFAVNRIFFSQFSRYQIIESEANRKKLVYLTECIGIKNILRTNYSTHAQYYSKVGYDLRSKLFSHKIILFYFVFFRFFSISVFASSPVKSVILSLIFYQDIYNLFYWPLVKWNNKNSNYPLLQEQLWKQWWYLTSVTNASGWHIFNYPKAIVCASIRIIVCYKRPFTQQ